MDGLHSPIRSRSGWPTIRAGIRIAVLIPCFNEELAVSRVIGAFRTVLPEADIYVYDNNSHDHTIDVARDAGAAVYTERRQGKGNVVRRMFADVEADVYVLVDGDDTYDATAARQMVSMLVEERLDMVTGARESDDSGAYRRGHRFGNAVLSGMVHWLFGNEVSDVLSGYRVFSRRFVKSFPALAAGFETEAEFTVHALELKMPVSEVATRYGERPQGSVSKLRTYSDGTRILRSIIVLLKEQRPLQFFGLAAVVLLALGVGLGIPVITEFLRTGLVPRLPTAVLSTGLVLLSCLSLVCGLILDSVARGRKEMKRLAYLSLTAPGFMYEATVRAEEPARITTPSLQDT